MSIYIYIYAGGSMTTQVIDDDDQEEDIETNPMES